MTRVLIGIPSLQMVDINFTVRLVGLVSTSTKAGITCCVQPMVNFALANAHNMLVDMARRFECSHLLLVETDNTFPHDALIRLLEADKPIVGATYLMRSAPHWAMGRELDKIQPINVTGGGVREVARLPVGCILIRMDVLDAMEAEQPGAPVWEMVWNGKTYDTDDYRFCDRARALGFSVWCDCGLSMEVGHMSVVELKLSDDRSQAVNAFRQPLPAA